ncbi:MAG TPA: type II toxin-antitoxin system RelE/ParE family toxin [Acidobacteriaceae bacterium]|nr:type II toxin-antitoxin system RelE/ParE family toxin [Acidobacteriaceae bacterium]
MSLVPDRIWQLRGSGAITETVLHILNYPHAARVISFSDPEISEIRRIPVNDFPRHLVFYQVTQTAVVIVRVLHGARDLESLFS